MYIISSLDNDVIIVLSLLEYNVESFDVQPYPFQFLREPEDHFTLSRADVTFACSVITVNGFSNILWYLNNTVIKAGPHHNISNNGQGASTLTIRNVSIEDQGDYHCSISDWKAKTRSRPGRLHGMYYVVGMQFIMSDYINVILMYFQYMRVPRGFCMVIHPS